MPQAAPTEPQRSSSTLNAHHDLELYGAASDYGNALRGKGRLALPAAAVALKNAANEYANRELIVGAPDLDPDLARIFDTIDRLYEYGESENASLYVCESTGNVHDEIDWLAAGAKTAKAVAAALFRSPVRQTLVEYWEYERASLDEDDVPDASPLQPGNVTGGPVAEGDAPRITAIGSALSALKRARDLAEKHGDPHLVTRTLAVMTGHHDGNSPTMNFSSWSRDRMAVHLRNWFMIVPYGEEFRSAVDAIDRADSFLDDYARDDAQSGAAPNQPGPDQSVRLRGDGHEHEGAINMLEMAICHIEAGDFEDGLGLAAVLAGEKLRDSDRVRIRVVVAPVGSKFSDVSRTADPRVAYVKSSVDRMLAARDPSALHRLTQVLDLVDWSDESVRDLFHAVLMTMPESDIDGFVSSTAEMVADHNKISREIEREEAEKPASTAKQEAA
jgi:hypothetical protein